MLVTLGTNTAIGANASHTYTYSPNSVQKVFLRLEDADWELTSVTVQIGSVTICNGISSFGLSGLSALSGNVSNDTTGTACVLALDFGSHQCTNNDNLYVTVQAGANAMDAVDCSALVDEPGQNFPVKLTQYSDTTFTSENNLFAIGWDASVAVVNEDTGNCEIRTAISSSAPTFASGSSWYDIEGLSADTRKYFAILNRHSVPLKTTYNYTADKVDRIIAVEQMGTSRKEVAQARSSARVAMSQAGK